MTTTQESPNGHCFPPHSEPPEPQNFSLLFKDAPPQPVSPEPMPWRCQFAFSDGRQCRMLRSDIHSSLCPFHAEREEQLFGEPSPAGHVVGAALDLPELYSACRDLSTVAGVSRALAQVFRLLAQRRISRQEAATFAHLARLLLRSLNPQSPFIPYNSLAPHNSFPMNTSAGSACNSSQINTSGNVAVQAGLSR